MKHLLLAFVATAVLPAGAYAQQEVGNGFVPHCATPGPRFQTRTIEVRSYVGDSGSLIVSGYSPDGFFTGSGFVPLHDGVVVPHGGWSSGGFVPSRFAGHGSQLHEFGPVYRVLGTCRGQSGAPAFRVIEPSGACSGSPWPMRKPGVRVFN